MALNERQRTFVANVANGMTKTAAYQLAYPKSSPDAATVSATRLLQKPEVQAELDRLRRETDTERALTREEKRRMLAEIARDPAVDVGDRMRAMLIDNRMAGHDSPENDSGHGDDFRETMRECLQRIRAGEPLGNLAIFEAAICRAIERQRESAFSA